MKQTNRPWEMWGRKQVEEMSYDWSFINDRHWSLITEVSRLVEGKCVLDVGCGMGHLLGHLLLDFRCDSSLLEAELAYLGIDTSEAMLEKARESFPYSKDKFQFGDAYDLSTLPDFDTVVATGLILHLPESEAVLHQLWHKAKTCVIFTAWIGETPTLRKEALMGRSLKQRILRKHFILRRETLHELYKIFAKLRGLGRIEEFPFPNPCSGESNYIFKLWKKKVKC